MWVQVLSGKLDGKDQEQVWLDACNASFAAMIKDKQSREAEEAKATVGTCPLLLDCKRRAFACIHRCCTHAAARAWPLFWLLMIDHITSGRSQRPHNLCASAGYLMLPYLEDEYLMLPFVEAADSWA